MNRHTGLGDTEQDCCRDQPRFYLCRGTWDGGVLALLPLPFVVDPYKPATHIT